MSDETTVCDTYTTAHEPSVLAVAIVRSYPDGSFDVAGLRAGGDDGGRQEASARRIRPGTKLLLRPEPDNPFDANAVAAYTRRPREKVGYLARDLAADVSGRLVGPAVVTAVLGGSAARPLRGVAVQFRVRRLNAAGT